eukprot:Nitzschia sp. Nitz4//scaffold20_size174350//73738//74730//NITZ4_002098-RA/size174350-processed-gene-0.269-mRNA-1//1//CDS//3329541797//3510//frame0
MISRRRLCVVGIVATILLTDTNAFAPHALLVKSMLRHPVPLSMTSNMTPARTQPDINPDESPQQQQPPAAPKDATPPNSLNSMEGIPAEPIPALSTSDPLSAWASRPQLNIHLPERPELLASERSVREAEIKALSSLNNGDDVKKKLQYLWMSERGSGARSQLQRAQALNQFENNYARYQAQQILLGLVGQYGYYLPEAHFQLAQIHEKKERAESAIEACKSVLAVKPWHFAAVSMIVRLYEAQGDYESARHWAVFRLPPYNEKSDNLRRARWVEQALTDATKLLEHDERRLETEFSRTRFDHDYDSLVEQFYESIEKTREVVADGGAWQ